MNKVLKKIQIIQFIIIIGFLILSYAIKDKEKLNKNTEYYDFLVKIMTYNKITKKIIKKKYDIIPFNEEYNFLLENNEYFYLFFSNNVYTYFFKEKDSNYHSIYFNGINNMNDIKVIISTAYDVINQNFNFSNIESILNRKGYLYNVLHDKIDKENIKYSVFEVFDLLYDNYYKINNNDNDLNNNEKINIHINGFSIGGPESQLFTISILEKYKDKFNIDMYNIESWFGGNKEIYNKLNENVKIFNMYNNKSVFYFFNIFFQKYFKTDYIVSDTQDNYLENIVDYNSKLCPEGIFDYILDYHLISRWKKKLLSN